MRIVATSDFHGTLPEIPECELLIIGGDICPVWDHSMQFQRDWLETTFSEWLEKVPAQKIVGVAGNHDFYMRDPKGEKLVKLLDWVYLRNDFAIIDILDEQGNNTRLKVWGSPYSNKFGGWAFMKSELELAKMWDEIPRDSDIIIVHGPPWGYGDGVGQRWDSLRQGWTAEHVGSTSLTNQLMYDVWPYLKLVVFGHIHEGYGQYEMKNWKMLNVSLMDSQYEPVNPPIEVEL